MIAGAGGCQLGLLDQGDLFDRHDMQGLAGSGASDVAPSPQSSRGAPLRAASGRLSDQGEYLADLIDPPYRCVFCGAPSWLHPFDQDPPVDYCHEGDHGEPDPSAGVVTPAERSQGSTT